MLKINKTVDQLHVQVLNMLDDILSIFPFEKDIVSKRLQITNEISKETLMDQFIEELYPYKNEIKQRNINFFKICKNDIVILLNKQINLLDEEDLQIVWDYFDIFLQIIIKYRKLK